MRLWALVETFTGRSYGREVLVKPDDPREFADQVVQQVTNNGSSGRIRAVRIYGSLPDLSVVFATF